MNKLILEEIQRMNLLSKYDNSKTLSEQLTAKGKAEQDFAKANPFIPRQAINQPQSKNIPKISIPGGISPQAYNKIIDVSNQNRKGFMGSYLAPLQQQEINKEFGADTYNKFFNNGGEALLKSGVAQKADTTPAAAPPNPAAAPPNPAAAPPKPVAKPVATPPQLKDIKAFQDWLDNNHGDDKEGQGKGWATRFPEGKLKQGAGYGKFGPRTQKAWATYKDQFLKGSTTPAAKTPETTTPAKVETPPTSDQPLNLQLTPQQSALNSLKYAQQ